MHILVVEDDVPLTRQITAALLPAGHDPVVIHDGEAALHAAAETAFDLIVIVERTITWPNLFRCRNWSPGSTLWDGVILKSR